MSVHWWENKKRGTLSCNQLRKFTIKTTSAHIKPRVVIRVLPRPLDFVACLQLQLFSTVNLIKLLQLQVNCWTHGYHRIPSSPLDNIDKFKEANPGFWGFTVGFCNNPTGLIHKTRGFLTNDEDKFSLTCPIKSHLTKQHNIRCVSKQNHIEHVHTFHTCG